MADTVTLSAGTEDGAVIATDDAGAAGEVQIIKLAVSADGSATVIPADAANGLDVDVTRSALPTGASTSAKQDTAQTALDAIKTATEKIDDAIAGTEMQVDVLTLPALPAGTNNIGDVDVLTLPALPAGTNNIGDVDVVSSTLPTGAATSAKQDTIIGHVDGLEGLLTTIDADTSNLSVVGGGTEAAAQRVTIASDSTGVVSVDDNGSTLSVDDGAGSLTVDAPVATPVFVRLSDGSAAIATLPVSLATVPSHAVTNAGTFVTQENGGALTALQLIDDTVFTDDAAFTPGTHKVNALGFLADQTSTDSVDEGDIGIPRMTLTRQQISTVAPSATTEGLLISRDIDLDETETEVKATAGKLYGYDLYNDGAAEVYVKFYNATAANVTVGTTTPVMTVAVPAGSGRNVEYTNGITFGTAICAAATTGVADGDTAAPAANQVVANIFYI